MKRILALCLILIGLTIRPALANDTVYYYHTDAQGTAVVVTDASHNVVERTYYGPYGEVLNRPLRDGPGYTGHEEDAATGLGNMQQRYYDPANGRFPSPDPMDVDTATGSNFNRYAYAADNPYRYVDPDGRGNTSDETQGQPCTGSHLPGSCTGASPVKINQIASPSVSAMQAAKQAAIGIAKALVNKLAKDLTYLKRPQQNGPTPFGIVPYDEDAPLTASNGAQATGMVVGGIIGDVGTAAAAEDPAEVKLKLRQIL